MWKKLKKKFLKVPLNVNGNDAGHGLFDGVYTRLSCLIKSNMMTYS